MGDLHESKAPSSSESSVKSQRLRSSTSIALASSSLDPWLAFRLLNLLPRALRLLPCRFSLPLTTRFLLEPTSTASRILSFCSINKRDGRRRRLKCKGTRTALEEEGEEALDATDTRELGYGLVIAKSRRLEFRVRRACIFRRVRTDVSGPEAILWRERCCAIPRRERGD